MFRIFTSHKLRSPITVHVKELLKKLMSMLNKFVFLFKNNSVYFGKRVQILGMNKTLIGENTCISDDCWFNVNQHSGPDKTLIIGKNSFIGRRNFFTVGKEIILGDYFFSSIDCSFICSTHLYKEYVPYILGDTDIENTIRIGCNVFVGAHSKIIGNVSIGYGSIIGANTTILNDVPPLSIVVGSEGKIIKRYNMKKGDWDVPQNADAELYLSERDYLNKILERYPHIPKIIHAASSRAGWL